VLADGTLAPGWIADGNPVCTAPGAQDGPTLASDGQGGAIIAWHDLRSGLGDVYAQHIRADGSVDPAWPADGRGVSVGPGDAQFGYVVDDGAHGALLAWYEKRVAYMDLYATHLRPDGTPSPGTPVDGYAVCTAPGNQTLNGLVQSLMADGHGGGFLAWRDLRASSTNGDIYAMHLLPSGAPDPVWPVNGLGVSTATLNQVGPALCEDGSGGALIAWSDNRSGVDYDIYAQRVTAAGVLPVVGVEAPRDARTRLAAPRPNPATGRAQVAFTLETAGRARVEVFDASGRRVRLLRDGETPAGPVDATWNLRDDGGIAVPPGLYLVRLEAAGVTRSQRIAVTR